MSDLHAEIESIRPELHRYAARMTGSIVDGEDVVQDALAKAHGELDGLRDPESLRGWLFQIAHHRALDLLRRYDRRFGESLDDDLGDDAPAPDEQLAQREAVQAAIARFLELPPGPRSCVILKDVLGHSVEEIGALVGLGLPAVKAALHRGRLALRAGARADVQGASSPVVARYVALFSARDWDGVRAMLADDVQLDLVGRMQRRGAREVGSYVSNYSSLTDRYAMTLGWHGGREVIVIASTERPGYLIALDVDGERIAKIRDFRYARYLDLLP